MTQPSGKKTGRRTRSGVVDFGPKESRPDVKIPWPGDPRPVPQSPSPPPDLHEAGSDPRLTYAHVMDDGLWIGISGMGLIEARRLRDWLTQAIRWLELKS